MSAPQQFCRQRVRRDHMSAGAPGGEHEMPLETHFPLHFTT